MKTFIRIFCTAAVQSFLTITVCAQDNPAPAAAEAPAQTEMQKWIATTDAQWQATLKREVTDVHSAELNKLKLQYLTALEEGIKKASGASDLDGAVALRNEQKRFGDTQVFPEQDDAGDVASVKQIRAAIRAQLAKLEKDSAARTKALHAKYDATLAQAQAQLTQRQRLDDALLVKAKRDEVATAWSTPAGAVAAPPAPPAPPHTGLAQVAPAQFNSVKDIIATVPKQSIAALQGGGKRAEPAAIQASEFLKTTATTKVASLHIRVLKVERAPGVVHAWRILAADETVHVGSTSFVPKIIAYFAEAQTAAVAKVKSGEQITVMGKMTRCDFTSTDKILLHIDLDETVIQ